MLARIRSAALLGIDAAPIDVEVDISNGLPSFQTVGLPGGAVREGRSRVAAALQHAGFQFPLRRITASLAPSDLPKSGAALDLPLALAVLAASGQLPAAALEGLLVVGELGLEGDLRPVRGVLSIALLARAEGVRALVVPAANAAEAAVVEGLAVAGARTLADVCAYVRGALALPPPVAPARPVAPRDDVDLAEVRGQPTARRALEVAAAGAHSLLFIGPPGAGKTLLARRLPTILPALTPTEALECTRIHSVAGTLPPGRGLLGVRPFRAPHATVSDAGLVGGGRHPSPGEVSLAHGGVLFLDELPEFRRGVLEALRQPLEDGHVTIARAARRVTFPARVLLCAAMNPCPCGWAGVAGRCRCAPDAVTRYRGRISGPLLDRFDLQLELPPVRYAELAGAPGEGSAAVRARVEAARAQQQARAARLGAYAAANAHLGVRDVRRACPLEPPAEALLREAMERLGLSARAYHRVLKVARTIADLAASEALAPAHVAEAIQYRALDRERQGAMPQA
ncbi:MAG: YifB family Mg chelatase-like AAA ATPase [Gemmatimonadales bacterium]|nr:YifB family Mg chelatase-like AAA ATPase [Gemmatimonadales bacterium]